MWRIVLFGAISALLCAQTGIFRLQEVRPDQQGIAKTVFRGQASEEFPVQILGVLHASGPGQNLILAKLLTPRLEQTGVMQGMSGSPVYIDGRLVGAIAFAFPFAKEPIAGIRPIEEMLAISAAVASRPAPQGKLHLAATDLLVSYPSDVSAGPRSVLTPISFAGLSENTLKHFADSWSRLGFVLQQGASGSKPGASAGSISPGDMISVQLLRGDLNAGADGTVTHRDGNKIYAFGHRFLSAAAVDFPFAKSEVLTPLPNYNTSFKISQSLAPAGAIRLDADAGVVGEIGAQSRLSPLRLRIEGLGPTKNYQAEMVRHTVLSPLLFQMAIFSALDHHMKSAGRGAVEIAASIRYAGLPVLRIQGRYAGDANLPLAASLASAIPLAYLNQQSAKEIHPEDLEVVLRATDDRDQWVVDSLQLSRKSVKPGASMELLVKLRASERVQLLRKEFTVPLWLKPGETLTVSVQDAFTANLLDFRAFYQPGGPVFHDARQLIETINSIHPPGNLYVRILRSGPGMQSGLFEMGNIPTSLATLLAKQPGTYAPAVQSKVLDHEFVLPSGVVTGSKTASLEIE